jgi:hypothetical protein
VFDSAVGSCSEITSFGFATLWVTSSGLQIYGKEFFGCVCVFLSFCSSRFRLCGVVDDAQLGFAGFGSLATRSNCCAATWQFLTSPGSQVSALQQPWQQLNVELQQLHHHGSPKQLGHQLQTVLQMEVLHESSTLITQVLLLDQVLEFNCCFFCSRDLCVMLLWFGITCAWAGVGSDKKLMMCFESCDSRSCSWAAIVTGIKSSRSADVTRSCEEREGRDNCGSSQRKSGSRSSYLPPGRNSQGWSSCCHSTGNKISALNSCSSSQLVPASSAAQDLFSYVLT